MSLTIGAGVRKCRSSTARNAKRTRSHRRRRSQRYGRFEIYLHGVANELIEEAVEYGCSHIVFEDLTHIRREYPEGDVATRGAFRQLFQYVEYKATEHGVGAVQVPPNHTPQRCSTWMYPRGQPRRRALRVLKMRVSEPRGLQRGGEEHRISVSPSAAKRNRWRRTCRRCAESRDVEREWEYAPPATTDGGIERKSMRKPPLNERGRPDRAK